MDTKTSVAENKGFHFRSGKHPQKKKNKWKDKKKRRENEIPWHKDEMEQKNQKKASQRSESQLPQL
jgi:hypothetical protein